MTTTAATPTITELRKAYKAATHAFDVARIAESRCKNELEEMVWAEAGYTCTNAICQQNRAALELAGWKR